MKMEKEIEANCKKFLIRGNWTLNGMTYNFDGQVESLASNNMIVRVEFNVPFSAIRKFGIDIMNEEICVSVKEHLEKAA